MSDTTIDPMRERPSACPTAEPNVAMLIVAWSAHEPARVGEALLVGAEARVFGRDGEAASSGAPRVRLVRQRPGKNDDAGPLGDPFVSREQLRVVASGDGVRVDNVGKRALLARGEEVASIELRSGDTVAIDDRLLFMCASRPRILPRAETSIAAGAFGGPDATGIVGESALAWRLRERIAFVARRAAHVLVVGESGSGKELVARAIHGLSPRADRAMIARNAATIPHGIADAELFGHAANYPNAGMPERVGLVGEAHRSTLFLDEIGELPHALQAHLLRVLDRGGEYQRLGETKTRASDLRLVAATNRSPEELKHDLAARLRFRIEVPGLNERREDVPLLARHVLAPLAASDPEIAKRFFDSSDTPRLSLRLVEALITHRYTTHVRELEALLWRSLASSTGSVAELTGEVEAALDVAPAPPAVAPTDVNADAIRASLARHGGKREKVWRDLGLASRHVLARLIRKHGLEGAVAE